MAKRSKQQKFCPAEHCEFPTKNRQSKLHISQIREIHTVDPTVDLSTASICSYCGCVYKPSLNKWPIIIGFHDDPRVEDRESDDAYWVAESPALLV